MQMLLEYLSRNFMTLILLAGLIVILSANSETKIKGVEYIRYILALVFILTLCIFTEYWCNLYQKPVWILYVKAAVYYIINPLMVLLELYLVAPVKHRILLSLPFAVNAAVSLIDLSGTNLIYGYTKTHDFLSGPLNCIPALAVCFYILLLLIYSLRFLGDGDRSKGLIVIFMSLTTVFTVYLKYIGFVTDYTTEVTAAEILIYYFYLAAIHQSKVQEQLYNRELELGKNRQELEQSKVQLLLAQIQPHFIYNSLMALQSKCMDNPEVYKGIQDFGKYLRSNFTAMTNNDLIPFTDELKSIRAYVSLERLNYRDRMRVEYDIEIDQFMVPALSVEPLVENAIRYGIGTYQRGGLVQVIVRDEPDCIEIEVRDDRSGGYRLTKQQKKRKSIGLANVRLRLKATDMGTLTLTQDEDGTSAVIRLKYVEVREEELKEEEDHEDADNYD